MANRTRKILIWFVAIVMVMACVPAVATPLPTADPNVINLFIAQTANAAASQTAAVLPTSTFTETPTPTPESTSTPSPTFTSTVIFILSSPTRFTIPTLPNTTGGGGSTGGGGATSPDNYACQVISVDPANGTAFRPRTDFDATWRVKNVGQKEWGGGTVDVVYDSGAKMHKIAGYDLNVNVKVGDTISIAVDMQSPSNAGSYTTHWVLRASANVFCRMTLTINVQ